MMGLRTIDLGPSGMVDRALIACGVDGGEIFRVFGPWLRGQTLAALSQTNNGDRCDRAAAP